MDLPTIDDGHAGAIACKENALRHRRVAHVLAEHKIFGPAASHLILASEEAVKAGTLVALGYGIELPTRDFKTVLRSHRLRHDLNLLSRWMDLLLRAKLPAPDEFAMITDEEQWNILELLLSEFRRGLLAQLDDIADQESGSMAREWWNNAESRKQQGFYVDFADGKWHKPTDITADEYERARAAINPVIDSILPTVEQWSKPSPEALTTIRMFVQEYLDDFSGDIAAQIEKWGEPNTSDDG